MYKIKVLGDLIQIANPSISLNWLKRRDEMGKIISDKYASKDDPIFTGRYTISNPKDSTKKPIKVNQENLKETDPFFDRVKEIKRK